LGHPRAQRESILTNLFVNSVAAAHNASAGQVALAWLLAIAPNVLLIAGTRTRAHLAENLAAGGLWLGDREIALLNEEFR
jgi:aryl-alcohol dehydrogenase-like predicted oxidoreductase